MRLGIFAKVFARGALEETLDAVSAAGLESIQFNFACVGLPTLPERIEPTLAQRILSEIERRSIRMAAVSGTCNLIHPDPVERAGKLKLLEQMIPECGKFGTSMVTLCTGTRDAGDMWSPHPDNTSAEAWNDLLSSLSVLLPIAESHGIVLGVEPEPGNVIDSAQSARRLLDEVVSPSLKIVFDAANLVPALKIKEQEKILRNAFDLLGPDIALAHAKDVLSDSKGSHVAAEKGALDYALYLSLLNQTGYDGPLILHSLAEEEVPASVTFLRSQLSRAATPLSPNTHA